VTLPPWDYLFLPFNDTNFPDIFFGTWAASLILLIALGVLYFLRTRALHRHPPFVDLWEWLWWTGLITFSMILVGAVFVFDFFIVLLTEVIGIGTMIWIRFVRFPPLLRAHEARLARERYYSRQKYVDPEQTIRKRGGGRRTQRRRRR
jgi:hypothetical protein